MAKPLQLHHAHSLWTMLNGWLSQSFDHVLLQGMTLGAVAFAIPILWSTYDEIKKGATKGGKDPNGILEKVVFSRIEKSFNKNVMLPSAVAAFIGLVIAPILPIFIAIVIEALVVVWFLKLGWKVNSVRAANKRSMAELIDDEDFETQSYKDLWNRLWKYSDVDAQDELEVDVAQIFNVWRKRVIREIQTIDAEVLHRMIKDFNDNLPNRTQLFMIKTNNLVSGLFELYYEIWKEGKRVEGLAENDKHTRSVYLSASLSEVSKGLKLALGRYLEFKDAYEYFSALSDHTETHLSDLSYIVELYNDLGEDILSQTSEHEDRRAIWNIFPQEWRITIKNLKEDKPEFVMPKMWNDIFLNWSRFRIFEQKQETDNALDTVCYYLFPLFNPPFFAKFFTYILNPYTKADERTDDLINHPPSFGHVGHMIGGSFDSKKGFKLLAANMTSFTNQQSSDTFDYFYNYLRAKETLPLSKVDNDIKQLDKRLSDSKDESETRTINLWLRFLHDLRGRMK